MRSMYRPSIKRLEELDLNRRMFIRDLLSDEYKQTFHTSGGSACWCATGLAVSYAYDGPAKTPVNVVGDNNAETQQLIWQELYGWDTQLFTFIQYLNDRRHSFQCIAHFLCQPQHWNDLAAYFYKHRPDYVWPPVAAPRLEEFRYMEVLPDDTQAEFHDVGWDKVIRERVILPCLGCSARRVFHRGIDEGTDE